MKDYPLKPTPEQLEVIKDYWEVLQDELNSHYLKVLELETYMAKQTGIENIEFIYIDGEYIGVGNAERTMSLIHMDELEKK